MPAFLYETHLHTQEVSRCGMSPAREMVLHHKALGFTGLFVTDHFVTGYSHGNVELPWEKRIDILLSGYQIAKQTGDEVGVDVYFAFEYPFRGGDFLIYGIEPAFLYAHPEMNDFEARQDFATFAHLIHSNGGFIVQAHPFRNADYIPGGMAHFQHEYIDGVEVINASHKDESFDAQAAKAAKALNLPKTSGSDTHSTAMSGKGYMAFNHRLKDEQEFIALVKKGECELIKKQLTV